MNQNVKVVVLGGGTGSFMLLEELKNHTKELSAIVNMADDGGSTGVLRDELGALPPGDIRQCLVALSRSDKMRDLFNYRFEEGTFGGHSFGNMLITALEKTTGSFSEAVHVASEILNIEGTVIPATLDNVRLRMDWQDEGVILDGEHVIDDGMFSHDPRTATLSLVPNASINPEARHAIEEADLIVLAPGDLYSSLGPLLAVDGMGDALASSKATKMYVCNLTTKHGQTDNFTVSEHADEIERLAGTRFLDAVVYSDHVPEKRLLKKYEAEQSFLVPVDGSLLEAATYAALGGNLLDPLSRPGVKDALGVPRSFIRHDSSAVTKLLFDFYNERG